MFLALQSVIVSASITSTVLSLDWGLLSCQQKSTYTFNDKLLYEYKIYDGQVRVNTTNVFSSVLFQMHAVYVYIEPTVIDLSLSVTNIKLSDRTQSDVRRWKFHWKHVGQAVAAARIVQNTPHEDYEIDYKNCFVTTIARDDLWVCKNASNNYTVIDMPVTWNLLPEDTMTEIRRFGLSCLREQICASMKNLGLPVHPGTKNNRLPTVVEMTANDAVDKSLIRIRKYMKLHDTIQLPDKRRSLTYQGMFPNTSGIFVATGGTFTNLSTIERSGNAAVEIQPNNYIITSIYTLREARMHYDNFNVQYEQAEFEGKMLISLEGLEITGSSSFNANDCHLFWRHITVTNIREVRYAFRSIRVVRGTEPELAGQAPQWMYMYLKELFESSLVQALYNAFDYNDTIYGPCMTRSAHIMLKVTNP